jgi:hypothetical protein
MADKTRNIVAFSSLARTATENSADLKNIQFVGCHIVIDVTAIVDTPSVVFTVQGKDETSGKYYTIIESAAIATVSTTVLKVYPGLIAVANLAVNDGFPMDFRVVATHGDADSITYSVAFNMIK